MNQNNGTNNDIQGNNSNNSMIMNGLNPQNIAMMNNGMNPNMMNPNVMIGMNNTNPSMNLQQQQLFQQQQRQLQLQQQMRPQQMGNPQQQQPQQPQQPQMFTGGQFNGAQLRQQQQQQQLQQLQQLPQQMVPAGPQSGGAQPVQHPYNAETSFVPNRNDPLLNGGSSHPTPTMSTNGMHPIPGPAQAKTPGMVGGAGGLQNLSAGPSRHASVSQQAYQQKLRQQPIPPQQLLQQQQSQPQTAAAAGPIFPQQQQQQALGHIPQAQFFPNQQPMSHPQQQQQQHLLPQQQQQLTTNPAVNLRKQISNFAIMKFLEFCEYTGIKAESDMTYWKRITSEYFNETGVFRYSIRNATDSRQFEFSAPLIPRFYYSIIQSGVTRFEFIPNAIKIQVLPNGTAYLESSRTSIRHWHSDDSYLTIYGTVRAMFNQQLKIDWFDFQTHHFTAGLDWPTIERIFNDNKEDEANPFENAETLKKKFEVFNNMSQFGLQESVMRVMQVSDVMSHLKTLMLYSTTLECSGPLDALNSFVKLSAANGNQLLMMKKLQQQQQQDLSPTSKALDKEGSSPSPKTLQKNSPQKQAILKTKGGATKDSITPTSAKTPKAEALILPKTPKLDISQSTLTKRRRISHDSDTSSSSTTTANNGRKNTAVSPKSVVPSSIPSPNVQKKKAKR